MRHSIWAIIKNTKHIQSECKLKGELCEANNQCRLCKDKLVSHDIDNKHQQSEQVARLALPVLQFYRPRLSQFAPAHSGISPFHNFGCPMINVWQATIKQMTSSILSTQVRPFGVCFASLDVDVFFQPIWPLWFHWHFPYSCSGQAQLLVNTERSDQTRN